MNVTKNKVYLIILGLAGLALLVDRVFLGGEEVEPQSASAGDFLLPRASTVTPAEDHGDAAPIPELPFPRSVDRFADGETQRDVFAPPGASDEAQDHNSTENADKNAGISLAPDAVGRAAFVDRHRISAIVHDEGLKIAVVDGRFLRVGAKLDGCELVEIERRAAHFKCYDGEAILEFTLGNPD